MATENVLHTLDQETQLHNAQQISVLMNWIERARALSDVFESARTTDPSFKQMCKKNEWYSVNWDTEESEALVHLVSIQEGAIRSVIQHNDAARDAHYKANRLQS